MQEVIFEKEFTFNADKKIDIKLTLYQYPNGSVSEQVHTRIDEGIWLPIESLKELM